MLWFFDHETCRILVPWPRIEPTLPALEGKVLTAGPPGESTETLISIQLREHLCVPSIILGRRIQK